MGFVSRGNNAGSSRGGEQEGATPHAAQQIQVGAWSNVSTNQGNGITGRRHHADLKRGHR